MEPLAAAGRQRYRTARPYARSGARPHPEYRLDGRYSQTLLSPMTAKFVCALRRRRYRPSMLSTVATVVPLRLVAGDRVRIVSPASPPSVEAVARGVELIKSWGLVPELGDHVFDRFGHFLAGRDEDRLGDLNDALRDPRLRAILTTRGGKGSYRIADRLDFEAARGDAKPIVGYSDITALHLAMWRWSRVVTMHGPYAGWDDYYGPAAAESLRRALMDPERWSWRAETATRRQGCRSRVELQASSSAAASARSPCRSGGAARPSTAPS